MSFMKKWMGSLGVIATLLMGSLSGLTYAQAQIPLELDKSIRQFVAKHPSMVGLRTDIEYVDPKIKIQSCAAPVEITLPARARPWGRVNLQLRCQKGSGWFQALPIRVLVYGEYVLTTKFIQAGYKILPSDVRIAEGDLSTLPDDLIRSLGDAVGRQVLRPIQAGSYISLNNLKEAAVIRVGDRVKVQVIGAGFQATGDGIAQSAGSVNEIIKVRLPDGQVLQGRVSGPGAVEINID